MRSWTVKVPLEHRLQLGSMLITDREYIFVRVDGDDGNSGSAWSLTRDLPVGAALFENGARQAVGAEIGEIERLWQDAYGSNGPAAQSGVAMRALSLVDIALWDLRARSLGVPIHGLLGGMREQVPVVAVSGYPGTERGPEEAAGRLSDLAAAGFRTVKVARWPNATDTATLISHTRADGLIVDAAWAWDDARSALAELGAWGDRPLTWLEDPFPVQNFGAYRELHSSQQIPLAAGDEIADPALLASLALDGQIDYLRIDAAIAGGFTGVRPLLETCRQANLPTSFHVGLPMHVHLAASCPGSVGVEAFIGEDTAFDPVSRLLSGSPEIVGGTARVPTREGMGCTPDWEQILQLAHTDTDTGADHASVEAKEDQ